MGIVFALLALLSWGIGDFLIQKSTRKFGDWIALFYISVFASVVLLPFVYKDLGNIFSLGNGLAILLVLSVVLLFAALFDFEALRIGKLSVMEPIYALEVPVTAALGTFVIREHLSNHQVVLVVSLMIGIFLVATKTFNFLRHISIEKGVFYAIFATLAMGFVNFLFGVASRTTSPLVVNWFTSLFLTFVCLVYLLINSKTGLIVEDFKKGKKLVLSVSFFDNLAWVAYAYSILYIPIAISIALSESYIALAALLGLVFNKEKLKTHQFLGLVMTIVSAVVLAVITEH